MAIRVVDIPTSMLRDVPWDPPPTPDDWCASRLPAGTLVPRGQFRCCEGVVWD